MDKVILNKKDKPTKELIDILGLIHQEAGHINKNEIDTFIFCSLLA